MEMRAKMRELPEVETIRRGFDKEAGGKKVKTAEVLGPMSAFPGHPNKKHLAGKLEGAKLSAITRKGMSMVIELDNDHLMVVNLGKGGTITKATPREKVAEDAILILAFTQGGQARFADASGTATISVVATDDFDEEFPVLANLGLDPVESPISWTFFAEMLRGRKARLKPVILDQAILAGLGEVYSDEILFEAGLRADRVAGSLTTQEIRRLYRSLVETLHDALKYRGTSLEGDGYVDYYGKPGDYAEHLKVFGLDKEPCRRCRVAVIRVRYGSAYTYMCEQCQI